MSLPIYEPGQARAYCVSKGWSFKESGHELILETCPVGGHGSAKFYLNDVSGLFSCKLGSCAASGNFYQLQRGQGDGENAQPLSPVGPAIKTKKTFPLNRLEPYKQALLDSPEAISYLELRGLTLETAKAWHLGYKEKDGVRQLMIPYVKGDLIVDIKYRLLPSSEDGVKPKYSRLGGESVLFGDHLLRDATNGSVIYLVEGELDAITMWQHGLTPVLSTTTGAGSFKPEWFDAIIERKPDKVVVCYDTDAAGQIGAAKIRHRLEANVSVVNLPLGEDVKDINEYFLTHSTEDFAALVKAASEPQEMPNVTSLHAGNNMLEEQLWFKGDAFDGVPSSFEKLNEMVGGGYWNGQLVVISGTSGTGKTSMVLQELMFHAKRAEPAYLLCLEMPEIMMMRKIYEKEFAIPMLKLTHGHVKELRKGLDPIPLYLGSKCRKLADVENTIRQAVKRFNLKVVAFDNINYFVRSIENQTQEIGVCTKLLKDLAVELHIAIIAISQPKKFDRSARMMNSGDLAWSAAIEQDSDTIILLHREQITTQLKDFGRNANGFIGNQSPYCLMRVAKTRYSVGGEIYLYFDGARSTYRELTDAEKVAMQNG